ncbi:hypothetical protein SLEP1_g34383 [Rubroshorea leprosula]|nr:hypothetical protein SLEP1_g34383 [Rubroshorea leprosula]
MASIMARIILHEKLKIADIGGLACSFFGLLFIFKQMLTTQVISSYYACTINNVAGNSLRQPSA